MAKGNVMPWFNSYKQSPVESKWANVRQRDFKNVKTQSDLKNWKFMLVTRMKADDGKPDTKLLDSIRNVVADPYEWVESITPDHFLVQDARDNIPEFEELVAPTSEDAAGKETKVERTACESCRKMSQTSSRRRKLCIERSTSMLLMCYMRTYWTRTQNAR